MKLWVLLVVNMTVVVFSSTCRQFSFSACTFRKDENKMLGSTVPKLTEFHGIILI